MTISYNWLSEYLPNKIAPEKLSEILTAIGLEVESMEKFEQVKGGLSGLVAGEVMSCEKHPEADKLKITTVNIGKDEWLNIVCGAPNVATGQKVIIAPIGSTIYPLNGESMTMKKVKIRGIESHGMICAEDEIGMGNSHEGIKILADDTKPGTPIASIFNPHSDIIFEIGLTPNRMDAMSHLGVARDVCAYLTYHEKESTTIINPLNNISIDQKDKGEITVLIENNEACMRYCGISIAGIKVGESPEWLKQKIATIGIKSINNIVDITNFILHETGQPLHAFDSDKIKGKKVIIKNAHEGAVFKTLDEKERKMSASDLMICNEVEPMCIAGVYGGFESGINNSTQNIFLESAVFEKGIVRKTVLKHELRTDAATRFEKGVDISNTLNVLIRAALLIVENCGGKIISAPIDLYPNPQEKTSITLEYNFLKKLSGKYYPEKDVQTILVALGFEIISSDEFSVKVTVPSNKSDIHLQPDIVEEIMRIDGLDNIAIPESITIAPSVEKSAKKYALKEKISNYMVGLGFNEIFTNSITNSTYYNDTILENTIKMMNSLSVELDVMRPQMIQSGLSVISHNINRKNNNLKLFEFGKTYEMDSAKRYYEQNHLAFYVTGNVIAGNWKTPFQTADHYYLKGTIENILQLAGFSRIKNKISDSLEFTAGNDVYIGKTLIGKYGEVSPSILKQFDIKNPVYFADLYFDILLDQKTNVVKYKELPKFPGVTRDLAIVVDKNILYAQLEEIALSSKINQLNSVILFDIFESDKLGKDKKSMALSFNFLDESKTLTDKEIDGYMQQLINSFEKELHAEIRK
jgi:phenylalanyl-tRNA synthetase beta chain